MLYVCSQMCTLFSVSCSEHRAQVWRSWWYRILVRNPLFTNFSTFTQWQHQTLGAPKLESSMNTWENVKETFRSAQNSVTISPAISQCCIQLRYAVSQWVAFGCPVLSVSVSHSVALCYQPVVQPFSLCCASLLHSVSLYHQWVLHSVSLGSHSNLAFFPVLSVSVAFSFPVRLVTIYVS
jgi:hypothetical protein